MASGLLETAEPFAAEPVSMEPLSSPAESSGPSITGRAGGLDFALVNGLFGDPLLHLRLRDRRRSLLFDLGAGARLSARVAHEISDVFISHAHIDHIAGMLWLIRSRIEALPDCRIYGPPGVAVHVGAFVDAILWDRVGDRGPRFTITEVHGAQCRRFVLQAGKLPLAEIGEGRVDDGVLLTEPGFRVRACTLDHGIPVLAFAFEPEPELHVRKDRLLARGIAPGPWLNRLKDCLRAERLSEILDLPDGRRAAAGDLGADLVLTTPGRKLAYATDFADTPRNRELAADLARGAHTFFCESPFAMQDAEQAARTGHLTTRACAEIANAAGVARLVPFHFSRRYLDDPERVYEEIAALCSRMVRPSPPCAVRRS